MLRLVRILLSFETFVENANFKSLSLIAKIKRSIKFRLNPASPLYVFVVFSAVFESKIG